MVIRQKIKHRIKKLMLEPIRVFCLHHVSPVFDPELFFECDWISSDNFIRSIIQLRREYTFISLPEAYERIKKDRIRVKKFAVLTFDDGYRSPVPCFHWLIERDIPFTLFLNAKYLDGESYSPHVLRESKIKDQNEELSIKLRGLYLGFSDLLDLNNPLVNFASHGYEHRDATRISGDEFRNQVRNNCMVLRRFPGFISYHAYTWGQHSDFTDRTLQEEGLIPVLMDGEMNYNDSCFIHRELFPVVD